MTNTRNGDSDLFESPFESQKNGLKRTMPDGGIAYYAFVPSQIEPADFDEKWWPRLRGFPFNIIYASARRGRNLRPAMASALYEPDLATFRETDTTRELTYFNKLGRDYRVRVMLKKAGGMETFKYKGEQLVASASGHDFASAMTQTTMIGIQKNEPRRKTSI